jgi:hypothetical protein
VAAKRLPKLDPVWMEALGFMLVDNSRIATLQWRNGELELQLSDTLTPSMVALRYTDAVQKRTVRRQQMALREVLLPAMGLEEHSEYDDYSSMKRTYIRPE